LSKIKAIPIIVTQKVKKKNQGKITFLLFLIVQVFVSPLSFRVLFVVAAAIRSAVLSSLPRPNSDSLMCSYCLFLLGLVTSLGGVINHLVRLETKNLGVISCL